MNPKISQMLQGRIEQFADYVYEILPKEKRDLGRNIYDIKVEDFVWIFKQVIMPVKDNHELILKMAEEKFGVSKNDVSKEQMEKLLKYLKLFCKFIEQI